MKRIAICLLSLALLVTSLPAQARSPVTTYKSPSLVVQSDDTFKFEKVDLDLLREVKLLDERFEKEGLVYHDPALETYLERVGNSVVLDKQLENVEWKFHVLRDSAPNAFALPNGSIFVNSGLLALLDDESELAAVLAHEVVHVSKRHTYRQNRSLRKKILAINILTTIGNWNPIGGPVGAAVSIIANVSPFMLAISVFGYSRDLEREADKEGLNTMTAAGYAPQGMVNSFKALQKDIEGEIVNSFYSDHPKLEERVNYTSSAISPTAKKLSEEEAKTARSDYLAFMETIDRHDLELALNEARFRSAVFIGKKLLELHPESSTNTFLLAEAYRMLGPRTAELPPKETTSGAKKKATKFRSKHTLEEQEIELMKTPEGQQAWKSNASEAERLYLKALEIDRFNAVAHRGLGMLLEKLGRKEEAASEYSKYLELQPNAVDSERFRRRLKLLRESIK
ncbi:MAG TPA: M48 family metalloprotease [Pyrinomonadaceae bacterium]|nr:M48 family metalloprotease [Pyrinomonadaceae bacterium]